MIRRSTLITFALVSAAAWTAASAQEERGAERAAELFEGYYEGYLKLFPRAATEVGDHRYDHLFGNDIGEASRAAEVELYRAFLERSGTLERESLTADERMSLDVLVASLESNLESLTFPGHLLPIDQMNCVPAEFADAGAGEAIFPFETVENYEDFLGRIDGFCEWVETAIANMQAGVEQEVVLPRLVAERAIERIEAYIVTRPEESAFWRPIQNLPAGFAEEDRVRLGSAYRAAIAGKLLPAYDGLVLFMREEYLPSCRESLAWTDLPRGPEWYAHLVRRYTTTDLTPAEIHVLGLREVERIGGELAAARERLAEAGEPPRYASAAELAAAYEAIHERLRPRVGELFTRFPKTVLVIEPTDWGNYYEPGSDDAARPGAFRFEVDGLASNPKGTSEALFLHEAIPGHHYQISLQRESELPRFRKGGFFLAYMEGWGLYAESLGKRLGLFREPHQEVDRLNSEMIRALRLVLDTGFHAEGWSMQEALDFIARYGYGGGLRWELERYVAWPGQALTYKVGELRILELRERARAELGEAFDIRAFHDVVLGTGAVPLNLLEEHVVRWIDEQS